MKKFLLTLLKPYNPKKCVIEECYDLDKYTIEQLLGSLSTYKISEMKDIKRERKEVAFNISKMTKDESEASKNMDEIEANIVKRLKEII